MPRRSLILLSVLTLGGCARDKASVDITVGGGDATARDLTPRSEGDVRITSTDGVLVFAVLGDSVVMQLGDTVRNKVQSEMKRDAEAEGAFVGAIIGAVGAAVNAALGVTVAVPAEAVHDLRYEDGRLHFRVDGNVKMQVKGDGDGDDDGGRFDPEDAERFMSAVRSAQERRARGGS